MIPIEAIKLETGAGTVSYRCAGNPSPLSLLFIHGAGGDSRLYLNQMQFFKERCRAIAIDLPAHGESKLPGLPSMDDYVKAIELVLEKENISRFVTAGHSMGGGISFELYMRMKEKIAGMVLMSTGAVLPVSDLVFDFLDKDYATFCDFLVKLSYSKHAPEMIKSLALRELKSADKSVVRNDFTICSRFDYKGLLPSINVPVLVLANKEDKMVPLDIPKELAREIPVSSLIVYDDSGHMPYLENHGQVNADIDAFIGSLV